MNVSNLKEFSKQLRELPQVIANKAAEQAAPIITRLAKESFSAGEDPYGVSWIPSVDGNDVTLRNTGALMNNVYYVAIGSKLRVALGVKYAKYQIGKRPVLPRQGSALPVSYVQSLSKIVQSAAAKLLGGSK